MKGKTILVVDENEDVTDVITQSLEAKGYKAYKLYDVLEAPVFFKKKREEIGMILLDMPLSNESSVAEVFFRIKDIDPKANIAIISGFHNQESAKARLQDNKIGFLSKPFSWNDLEWLMREIEKTME